MRRPKDKKAVLHCDASYATDKDQCRSVSGMIGTLGGMINDMFLTSINVIETE